MIAGTVHWLERENSQQFRGNAMVIDGDSLRVDGREIRLSGIDAPEYRQICNKNGKPWRCGIAARDALRKLTRRAKVVCQTSSVDQYDRWLGRCFAGETAINRAMVEQGWAVDFGGFASFERSARAAKRGIWQSDFQRPRDWREANRGSVVNDAVAQGWFTKIKAWLGL